MKTCYGQERVRLQSNLGLLNDGDLRDSFRVFPDRISLLVDKHGEASF